jgi:hemerythrin-like domain-containing protein
MIDGIREDMLKVIAARDDVRLITSVDGLASGLNYQVAGTLAMQATSSLRRDHDLIEKMLKALAVTADMLSKNQSVPKPVLDNTIDFITNFTNVCHHGKEEQVLFPALVKNGMPREGGPIARMIFEHEITKRLAENLRASSAKYADSGDSNQLISDLRAYIEHVSSHLAKENLRLFAMADMILAPAADKINEELNASEAESLATMGKTRGSYESAVEQSGSDSNASR